LLSNLDPFETSFIQESNHLTSLLRLLKIYNSKERNQLYIYNHTNIVSSSISGENIHGKSTQRMRSGVSSYAAASTNLIDTLTKREHLIRDYS